SPQCPPCWRLVWRHWPVQSDNHCRWSSTLQGLAVFSFSVLTREMILPGSPMDTNNVRGNFPASGYLRAGSKLGPREGNANPIGSFLPLPLPSFLRPLRPAFTRPPRGVIFTL